MVRLFARFVVAFMLVALVLPTSLALGQGSALAKRQQSAPVPLDLASIALRPTDPGLHNFRVAGGWMVTVDEAAAMYGETVESLEDQGYGRHYLETLLQPAADGSDCAGQGVSTWVYESSDEASAEERFQESIAALADQGLELLDDAVGIGDDALLFESPMPDCGNNGGVPSLETGECETPKLGRVEPCEEEFSGLHLVYLFERIEVHVWIFSNADPDAIPETAIPVTRATVEELALISLEKAEQVLNADPIGPLEPMVQRVNSGIADGSNAFDDFARIDGEDVIYTFDTAESARIRAERSGEARDVYSMGREYTDDSGKGVNRYRVTIYRFDDEDEAADWMGEVMDRLEEDETVEDLRPYRGIDDAGDEVIGMRLYNNAAELSEARVYLRVGSDIAVITLNGEELAPLEIVDELVGLQAECLEAGYCARSVDAPVW